MTLWRLSIPLSRLSPRLPAHRRGRNLQEPSPALSAMRPAPDSPAPSSPLPVRPPGIRGPRSRAPTAATPCSAARRLQVSASVPSFRKATQTIEVAGGASKPLDFTLDGAGRGDYGHSHEARAGAARRAVLGRGADRGSAAHSRRRGYRGCRRERGRADGAESRTRPEPGRHPRRVRRPDRARSAWREGAGRRLPRRVGDRSRSSRRISTCSTRIASRCCADHKGRFLGPARSQEPFATSRTSRSWGPKAFAELGGSGVDGGSLGGNVKLASTSRWATRRRCVSRRTSIASPATSSHDSRLRLEGGRERRFPNGVRAAIRSRPTTAWRSRRIVYQRVKMDGWNRIDVFNILANPFTTTRPAVRSASAAVHAARGGVQRRLRPRRRQRQLRLRRPRPHVDHVLRLPRHSGDS